MGLRQYTVAQADEKFANRKLEDEGTDKDLSELVERLLGMYLRGEIS